MHQEDAREETKNCYNAMVARSEAENEQKERFRPKLAFLVAVRQMDCHEGIADEIVRGVYGV